MSPLAHGEAVELSQQLDQLAHKIAEELQQTTSDHVMQQIGMSRMLNALCVRLQSGALDLDNDAKKRQREKAAAAGRTTD